MPELVAPSARYRVSFIDAVREAQATGSGLGDTLEFDVAEMERDFGAVLTQLRRFEPPATVPEGFVNSEARWLVEGETYLGRVSIRHHLNERLRVFGGHIGYEIRPSARQRGYGTLALRLALERARELGLERVLVTCDVGNAGSRRIIEAHGGELEGEFRLDFHPQVIRRYWIGL